MAIHPVIADIRDADRIQEMFRVHRPQVVFHAAAHKHVPLMEANAEEAITNNILGTRNVVEAANTSAVERLVLISTDKAVRPVSIFAKTDGSGSRRLQNPNGLQLPPPIGQLDSEDSI